MPTLTQSNPFQGATRVNKTQYDILVIVKAHLSEDKLEKLITNFKKWITSAEGEINKFEDMGLTDMPITFEPARQGHFLHCEFAGTNATLENLRSKMKVDENFIRDLIVTIDSIRDTKIRKEKVKAEKVKR